MIFGQSCTHFAKKMGWEVLGLAATAHAHSHGNQSLVLAHTKVENRCLSK
jgi:hypothetical protein